MQEPIDEVTTSDSLSVENTQNGDDQSNQVKVKVEKKMDVESEVNDRGSGEKKSELSPSFPKKIGEDVKVNVGVNVIPLRYESLPTDPVEYNTFMQDQLRIWNEVHGVMDMNAMYNHNPQLAMYYYRILQHLYNRDNHVSPQQSTNMGVSSPVSNKKTPVRKATATPRKKTESNIKRRTSSRKKKKSINYSDYDEEHQQEQKETKVTVKKENSVIKIDQAETPTIELILSFRIKEELETDDRKYLVSDNPNELAVYVDYEYLIKWKNQSYLHLSWVHSDFVLASGRGSKSKLVSFWKTILESGIPEEDYNPEYIEVDRVIAETNSVKENGLYEKKYLVKWMSQSYSEATWESIQDINLNEKIAYYVKVNTPTVSYQSQSQDRFCQFLDGEPVFKNDNVLRSYQLEGVNWLLQRWKERLGSILADEMGLGKTIQSIVMLEMLNKSGVRGPHLVVAPLTTLRHWEREFQRWTNFNVVVYQGNKNDRALCRNYEWYYHNNPSMQIKFDVLITTYEMILSSDWEFMRAINWTVGIVDEAQRAKNHLSKFSINMHQFKIDHRILLTGTPLQNNTTELWALLSFINPTKFDSLPRFLASYGNVENSLQVDELRTVITPFLLRRVKETVEKSIPPKVETVVEVPLTMLQKRYYRAIFEKNRMYLERGSAERNTTNLLNIVMQLRKVCNHPYLVDGCEDSDLKNVDDDQYFKSLVNASGKLIFLNKLLPKLIETGHKVLIFSQMIRVLDILETYLSMLDFKFERLDGNVRGSERQQSIDKFTSDPNTCVFLLCTRAGGVGINLTAADTVIIYDSDWNPQNDLQAQARCHRIGQEKEVKVYRLITVNTYERFMFERASKKLGLDQALLSDMGIANVKSSMDSEKIETLLKYGAYALLSNDTAAEIGEDEDIDKILERSASTVDYNNVDKENTDSSYSSAKFTLEDGKDIDLDSPNFWQQVLPDNKSGTWLLENIKQGTAFQDPETFYGFLKNTLKTQRFNWDFGIGEKTSERSSIIKVIQKCIDSGHYTLKRIQKLRRFLREIDRPTRKRKRTGTDNESVKKKKIEEEDVVVPSINFWTHEERIGVQDMFFKTYGNWNELKIVSNLQTKTTYEIYYYCQALLKKCIAISSNENQIIYQKLLDNLPIPRKEDVEEEIRLSGDVDYTSITDPKINYLSCNHLLLQNIDLYAEIGDLMYKLNEISDGIDNFNFEIYPFLSFMDAEGEESDTQRIVPWWSNKCDTNLLKGALVYGWGNMENILADMNYHFYLYKRLIHQEDPTPDDYDIVACNYEEDSNSLTIRLNWKIPDLPEADLIWPSTPEIEQRMKFLINQLHSSRTRMDVDQ